MGQLTIILLISFLLITFYTIIKDETDISVLVFNIILFTGILFCSTHDTALSENEKYILLVMVTLFGLLLIPNLIRIGRK